MATSAPVTTPSGLLTTSGTTWRIRGGMLELLGNDGLYYAPFAQVANGKPEFAKAANGATPFVNYRTRSS